MTINQFERERSKLRKEFKDNAAFSAMITTLGAIGSVFTLNPAPIAIAEKMDIE